MNEVTGKAILAALTAGRSHIEVAVSHLCHADTTRSQGRQPYRRRGVGPASSSKRG